MKARWHFIIALFVFFPISCTASPKKVQQKKTEKVSKYGALVVGDVIPEFVLNDIRTNKKVSFEKEIRGKSKLVAFSFFTSSCISCMEEIALLKELSDQSNGKFDVYAVNVYVTGNLDEFMASLKPDIKYLSDTNLKLLIKFGFSYTPSMVLADKDGKILYLKSGYGEMDSAEIMNEVKKALADKSSE